MPLRHRNAHLHVYKLLHVSYLENIAWHPDFKWTQFQRGRVFTYEEAYKLEHGGLAPRTRGVPEEGRWHAVGTRIPLSNDLTGDE